MERLEANLVPRSLFTLSNSHDREDRGVSEISESLTTLFHLLCLHSFRPADFLLPKLLGAYAEPGERRITSVGRNSLTRATIPLPGISLVTI